MFVDTIIVCTMTALVVLCTGVWTEGGTGAALTATAFGAGFGNAIAGTVFVVAIITFFAFTTALVNVYYGEICMTVLGGKKFILPYRLLGCAFAIIGSVGALSVLWNLFDFFFGVCAVCNWWSASLIAQADRRTDQRLPDPAEVRQVGAHQ